MRFPFLRQSVVPANHKNQILRALLSVPNQSNKRGGVHPAATGIEEYFARLRMPGEEIESPGRHFAHFATGVAAAAFQKLGRNRAGMAITRSSDVIEPDLHSLFDYPAGRRRVLRPNILPRYCLRCM